ncbi:MAG: ParB/RepB/Spo0J family partition protein [Pseudomonadota bacterium]
MSKRPGLGRGLSALLQDIGPALDEGEGVPISRPGFRSQAVAIDRLQPNAAQPRKRFDEAAQAELIDSVRRQGLLQPILVRPRDGGRFEIVAGERRWRAAKAAQLTDVPVVIRDLDDGEAYEIALIENIQRQDLSPIEEARGYRHLIGTFGHTQEVVANLVGKSRSHITNLLRLLDLPAPVMAMVDEGRLGMGHARTLVGREDAETLAQRIVEDGLSVRDAEAVARTTGDAAKRPRRRRNRDGDLDALERRIMDATGMTARLNHDDPGGQLVVRYRDLEELDALVGRLTA